MLRRKTSGFEKVPEARQVRFMLAINNPPTKPQAGIVLLRSRVRGCTV